MITKPAVGAQTLILVSGTALSQVITAVLFIVTARISGVADFGQVAASVAIGMVGAGLMDFGFNSLFTRDLASKRVTLDHYWARAKSKLAIGFLLASIWFVLVLPLSFVFCLASSVFFSVLALQTLLVPLRAQSRIPLVAILFLSERISAALVFLILIFMGQIPSISLIISLVTGTCISSLIAWTFLNKILETPRARRHKGSPWGGSRNYGISSLANSLQQLDLPLLAILGGPVAAGIYGSISKWTQPLGLIANSFATASTPVIAKVSTTKQAIREVGKSAWLIVIGLFIVALMIPLSPYLVNILLGSGYRDAVPVFQIVAIGTIPGILNQILASGLQARGYDKQVALIGITSVIIQLGLVAIFSKFGGALSVAAAFCVLQVTSFASLSILLYRKLKSEDLA